VVVLSHALSVTSFTFCRYRRMCQWPVPEWRCMLWWD